jgi:hypothetical protein
LFIAINAKIKLVESFPMDTAYRNSAVVAKTYSLVLATH